VPRPTTEEPPAAPSSVAEKSAPEPSSAAEEPPAAGTSADSRKLSLPEKLAQIQEKLGLTPGGRSHVAAVSEAHKAAGIKSEGGPLVAQVDRLMAQLFGEA